MSQPSPDYERNYSFTDHSAQQPNVPQPGSWLDIEFNDIKDILNNTGSRLSEIQQDDGKINGDAFSTYTYNQIAQSVAAALNLEADYATKTYVNSQGFITSSELSPYLQTSIAQSTFLTIATAASTYQPISGMSSYATQSWVESQGYLTGSLDYLPLAGGTLTGDIIFPADLSGNDSQIGPWGLGVENTNGQVAYIQPDVFRIYNSVQTTGTSLNGEGITFNDSTKQITAGLPLIGGIMSGNIRFDEVGIQSIGKGTFDAGRGAYNGISLICANDVELNWQAGYLKAMYNGSVVPINLESDLVLTKNIDGVEEEIPPYTRTTTISLDGGISYNGNNSNDDHNFSLSQFGVNGSFGGDDHWSLGVNGVQNGGNGNHDNWYLNASAVGRTNENGAAPWSFGDEGAKFVDGTIQTTAGITIDSYEGGINFEATNTYGGFRVYQTRNDGNGDYLAIGQLNTFGFNFVSEGNPNGDWNYGQFQDGIHFNDGTIQTTAGLPLTGGTVVGGTVFNLGEIDEFDAFAIKHTAYPGNYFFVSPYKQYFQVGYGNSNHIIFNGGEFLVKNGNVNYASFGSYGIKFSDNTSQNTAFIPADYAAKTGATFTGKVNVNTGTGNVPLNIGITGTPTAYTNGDVWIAGSDMRFRDSAGTTKILISASNSNAFTNYQSISVSNNSNPALKITQLGTGEALRVEDETSPDATAFVVSNNGRVGIGVAPDATVALTVDSTGIKVNGATLIPAAAVSNPPVISGNMSHSEYLKELVITINGVNYAIPLRVV